MNWIYAVGFAGQGCFFTRFLVQWLASERVQRVVLPEVFWYFSVAGGVITLVYGILREDPVIIVSQITGTLIYLRNIYLIRHRRRRPTVADGSPA